LLVSLLAIALGVALGYAVQLINASAVNEFGQALQSLSGTADLTVRGPRSGFDETLYPRLARLPGIAVASPMMEAQATLAGQEEALQVIGLDVFRASRIQPLLLGEADDLLDALRSDTIFLSPAARQWLRAQVGDVLRVRVGGGEKRLRVAGWLPAEGTRARMGVMDIAAAQQVFERFGAITRVDLRLRPGADLADTQARVQELLPPGVVAQRPQSSVRAAAGMTRAYRVNLNVLALVALFTGALLVFSSQALAVVRRRSQIALLRVIGLTRRGVLWMSMTEAALLGAVGAGFGLLLGHALAGFLLRLVGADLGAGHFRGLTPKPIVDPLGVVSFFLLGVGAALAGSLPPAMEAARTAPARALKAGDDRRVFSRLASPWPALVLTAAGALAVFLPPVSELPIFGYIAIASLLLGTIMLMPLVLRRLLALLPMPHKPALQLAQAQLFNAPGPASAGLAAIVAAVSLTVSMAIMVASFRQSLDDWLQQVLPADLYVRAAAAGDTAYFSATEQMRIAAVPSVRRVMFLRSEQIVLDASRPPVTLLARDIDIDRPQAVLPLVTEAGSSKPAGLAPIWVSEQVVDVYGIRAGQTVDLPIAGRRVRCYVAGVWRDYARQSGAIVIPHEVFAALSGDARVSDAAVWTAGDATPALVASALRSHLAGGSRLEIAGPGEIRALSLRIFDRSFAATYALEAAAIVIGLFGLSSSITGQILARRREFGMLRHLGMARRQIVAMVTYEGMLTSGVGLLIGAGLGWLISLILIHVVNRQSFHWSMDVHIPWLGVLAFCALMLALACLTAMFGGRQAMRGDLVRSVREDW
jgi:putative ABC transport system permease protein